MFARAEPDLKFRFLWLAIGYALILLVVYLSLSSTPVDLKLDFPYQDKVFHALAYFALMFWFSQIYHNKFQRNMIALVLIFMGMTLEYLQGFDANRVADFADTIANVTGVASAFYLSLTKAKNCLLMAENLIS
jgi:VanZ family protein